MTPADPCERPSRKMWVACQKYLHPFPALSAFSRMTSRRASSAVVTTSLHFTFDGPAVGTATPSTMNSLTLDEWSSGPSSIRMIAWPAR